jgi:hypothetical protein
MRDYLRTLNKNELFQLEKLLCTNEEINLAQSNSQQQNNTTATADESTAQCIDESNKVTVIVPSSENKSNENFYSIKNGDDNSEWVAEENPEGRDEVDDEIEDEESSENYEDENLVTADCSTGYLVPNTNLGKFS